jgi:hypothetical protein
MKIIITKNVSHGGKIHKTSTTPVDLPAKDAKFLIEKEFATEYTEPAQQQQQQQQSPVPTAEQLQAKYGAMSEPELGAVMAAAKKVKTGDADYAQAQAVIAFIKDLLE